MAYYLEEYRARRRVIGEALVMALFELLNTRPG